MRRFIPVPLTILCVVALWRTPCDAAVKPNILIVFTDDQRWDAFHASGNDKIDTPNLDSLAERGMRFTNAFVTLSICGPSRAAMLTARYNSANGVVTAGGGNLNKNEVTFAQRLKPLGYRTGVAGKWHLATTPTQCGFDFASTCKGNGTWYGRQFERNGEKVTAKGFVDDFIAAETIGFMEKAKAADEPFVFWMCTQVPHMDHKYEWPALPEYLDHYHTQSMPLTPTWNDDLSGKPAHLKTSRSRTQAIKYGYEDPEAIRRHTRDYYASVEQMDASLGRVLDALDRLKIRESTWILFMADNGWMMGDHGFTSKVLAYEESIRVPMMIVGPGVKPGVCDELVLGIDLSATILDVTGLDRPDKIHGRSLLPLAKAEPDVKWRHEFLYEAPKSQLETKPLWAVRNDRWKYVETLLDPKTGEVFQELYDLENDPQEMRNLANSPEQAERVSQLAADMVRLKKEIQ